MTHVITTHDLLPKFKSVLKKAPKVKHVIFIEDQIHQTDRTGYKEGVEIHSFEEVVAKGSLSKAVAVKPLIRYALKGFFFHFFEKSISVSMPCI